MTTDVEKKFFEEFGIEPKEKCKYFTNKERCKLDIPHTACICECIEPEEVYPKITDRILLELIVINNENAPAVGDTLDELRNQVLYWCIVYKKRIYHQVRKLFGLKK